MTLRSHPARVAEVAAVCLCIALCNPVFAVTLFPDPIAPVGKAPRDVAAADFNGDGVTDLAVANNGSNDISVLFGTGEGDFQPQVRIPIGSGVIDLVAVDLDQNGAPDLAVTRGSQVAILLNDGLGSFSLATPATVGSDAFAIVTGDFDEDGLPDLAVANSSSADVSILLGTGDGLFEPQRRFAAIGNGPTLASADFDGDHHLDLLVGSGGSNNAVLLTGSGDGNFVAGPPFFYGTTQSIAAADLDGDGRADTIQTDFSFDRVIVRASVAGQGFPFRGGVASVSGPHSVVLSDINRDGRLDVLAGGNGGVSVSLGLGGFLFGSPQIIDVGGFVNGVAVATLDAGLLPDVAAANILNDTVSLVLNPATRSSLPPSRFAAGDQPLSIGLGDFDADGHLDAVVANSASADLSILDGRGDGTLAPQVRIPLLAPPSDVRIADFDRDGTLDLAVMQENAKLIDLLMGRGDGTFRTGVTLDVGFFAFRLAAADLTGDGIVDLVTTGEDSLALFPGNGDGTFAARRTIPAAGLSYFLAPVDLTGDGVPDLASALPFSNSIGLLRGTGGGAFGPQTLMPTGQFPYSVAAADFNGDGLADLVSGNSGGGTLAVFLNLGGGLFTSPALLPTGKNSRVVATGDLDADGFVDLAVTNDASNDVSVLLGHGDGTFDPERRFRAGGTPQYLAIGDLDEDGLPDLVTGNFGSDDLSVLLNQAPGANHPPVAAAGPDLVVECASPAGSLVRLDGSQSTGDIISYEWLEIAGQTEVTLAQGSIVDLLLSLGQHDIVLRVTDRSGATSMDDVVVTVQDTIAPVLSVELSPALLWPPNHRLVAVTTLVLVSDACGDVSVTLDSIGSDEPDDIPGGGDGSTIDDIQGADLDAADFEFSLRAERSSQGAGRTYTVVYRALDAALNGAYAAGTALVPLTVASVTEPLMLSLRSDASGDTVIEWTPVQGAGTYRVVRGEVGNVTIDATSISLGPLACLSASAQEPSLTVPAVIDTPAVGQVFFYMAEYLDRTWTSLGTDSAALPRIGDACP